MDEMQFLDQYRDKDGFIRLKRTFSELYKKSLYTTPATLVQNRIIEYDIKSAGLSALKASGKFKKSTIDTLESLPKDRRNIEIGNMRKQDSKITTIIKNGIQETKRMLFQANGIQDEDVISIKNDAVFIAGRRLKTTDFGEFHFVAKNTYNMFIMIEKIEFYYDSRHDRVDVKGIGDDICNEPDHQNGMLTFFRQVFKYVNQDRIDDLRKYLLQFVDDYKSKKLPICFYREFNGFNFYRTKIELAGYGYNTTIASEADRDIINGIYNYTRYILPIVQRFM